MTNRAKRTDTSEAKRTELLRRTAEGMSAEGEKMITRETLEELWFQKLMEDYARERGELLIQENERLKADPDAAVPEDVRRHNLETIERVLARREK